MKAVLLALVLAVAALLCLPSFAGKHARTVSRHSRLLDEAPATARRRTNPFEGNADAVRAGQKLFRRYCSACHGQDRSGSDWAPGLSSSRVRSAPPGALAWFLRNGDLRGGMPSWSQLPDERRWQIVSFLQANH